MSLCRQFGTGYGYALNENYFTIFTDRDRIASLLEIRMHGTESEAFVRRIWDSYLGKEKDGSRGNFEDEVTMEYEVELKS